jgi:hypothetical protein
LGRQADWLHPAPPEKPPSPRPALGLGDAFEPLGEAFEGGDSAVGAAAFEAKVNAKGGARSGSTRTSPKRAAR